MPMGNNVVSCQDSKATKNAVGKKNVLIAACYCTEHQEPIGNFSDESVAGTVIRFLIYPVFPTTGTWSSYYIIGGLSSPQGVKYDRFRNLIYAYE